MSRERLHRDLDGEWRDPAAVVAQTRDLAPVDPRLLEHRARGEWWDILAQAGATVLVTREYEHLVMALSVVRGRPRISYLAIPHPSGLVADRRRRRVLLASTRNPNLVYEFGPLGGVLQRDDVPVREPDGHPLVPLGARFLPGSLYLHDLALVGGELHGNAVAHNAVVRISPGGAFRRVWWPKCIESGGAPRFGRNYLQLNSIAAGSDLRHSFFSASTDRISTRRPGHRNFPVDRRGVLFSGATREPVVRGLTRPHSARLFGRRLWVDNSGYGELAVTVGEGFDVVARLPGWTRGLCFVGRTALVGVSRVLPRFVQYAPGLDAAKATCGVYAVDLGSGEIRGSLEWPAGNQIFGLDWLPARMSAGFPDTLGRPRSSRELYYAFARPTEGSGG